jgi:hypothetical protein
MSEGRPTPRKRAHLDVVKVSVIPQDKPRHPRRPPPAAVNNLRALIRALPALCRPCSVAAGSRAACGPGVVGCAGALEVVQAQVEEDPPGARGGGEGRAAAALAVGPAGGEEGVGDDLPAVDLRRMTGHACQRARRILSARAFQPRTWVGHRKCVSGSKAKV